MEELKVKRTYNKFGVDKKALFLEKVAGGMRFTSASKAAGVDRSTVYNWLQKDPEFAEAYKQAEVAQIELVEDALIQQCLKGNATCLIFFLTNRAPDRYADRRNPTVIQHTMSRDEAVSLLKARGITEIEK